MSSAIKNKKYCSEHVLFTFNPADSADYEIFDDMKIAERLEKYTEWFRNNNVSAKKYSFKKYTHSHLTDGFDGHISVLISDKKIDTLFRLTWI